MGGSAIDDDWELTSQAMGSRHWYLLAVLAMAKVLRGTPFLEERPLSQGLALLALQAPVNCRQLSCGMAKL